MLSIKLLLITSLLMFAEAGKRQDKACYNKYLQQCFVDNNLSLGSCTATTGDIGAMIGCVAYGGPCSTSPFYMAIIMGYRRKVMEQCQLSHCLTPMQNCMPKTKDHWHQLPTTSQGNADICSEFGNANVQTCVTNVHNHCENVLLHGFKETIDLPIGTNSWNDAFCNNNAGSCLMTGLKELPASYMSFTETGNARYVSMCSDRANVNTALLAAEQTPQCQDFANIMEWVTVTSIRGEYEALCGELCIDEARLCFEDYFGKKAKKIKCSGDKTALLSCLNAVKTTYTCTATEIATIDSYTASVNANC